MLHLTYLAARRRSNGALVFFGLSHSIFARNETQLEALSAYTLSCASTPEGSEFRQVYSCVIYVVDNQPRAHHEFPNSDAATEAFLAQEIAATRQSLANAASVELRHANAASALAAATAELEAARRELASLNAIPGAAAIAISAEAAPAAMPAATSSTHTPEPATLASVSQRRPTHK